MDLAMKHKLRVIFEDFATSFAWISTKNKENNYYNVENIGENVNSILSQV